ncbi:MAG TPA: DNA-3-methyladenine glycosylase I [Thermoanaerobaculia bacterium]
MTYCDAALGHPYHGPYHDQEYGFPIRDDDRLFERLILEINQAGLSWLTILKKREAFSEAFAHFELERVARFDARKRARLMENAGIIRNRLKIEAAVENAKRILAIRKSHGSFAEWLDAHHPCEKSEWVKLFKKTFVFTGGEITGSFLLSTGYLPGAHEESCPMYRRTIEAGAPWAARPLQP